MRCDTNELVAKAREMRRLCMRMSHQAGAEGAHVGPALSIADIMTVLYFDVLDLRVDDPKWEDRDRFILSKGHGVLGLYAPLILRGFISEEESLTFNRTKTRLAGHPSGKGVAGIEHPSGSLGHGLSVACGIALAAKMDGRAYKTYVLLGDGEVTEGSVWEAALFARQYQLDNLVAIVDVNGFQYGSSTPESLHYRPMLEKWRAFGWNVLAVDGHDVSALRLVLDKANLKEGLPTCVVAKTVKGQGLSFTAGDNAWHHVDLTAADLERSLAELQ